MSVKLYKFRALSSDTDLCRATDILCSGRFWCSRFWELNDAMEGVYSFYLDTPHQETETLFQKKGALALCSFSGRQALEKLIMWGYYANGLKGIAIEIEIEDDSVREMTYQDAPPMLDAKGLAAEEILTRKSKAWKHEHEYRFFVPDSPPGLYEIGHVSGVIIGTPHASYDNEGDFTRPQYMQDYHERVRQIRCVARRFGISCRNATIDTRTWKVRIKRNPMP